MVLRNIPLPHALYKSMYLEVIAMLYLVPRVLWWAYPPQTRLQAPPNCNMKHYKLVEFLSNVIVKPHCTNEKPPA